MGPATKGRWEGVRGAMFSSEGVRGAMGRSAAMDVVGVRRGVREGCEECREQVKKWSDGCFRRDGRGERCRGIATRLDRRVQGSEGTVRRSGRLPGQVGWDGLLGGAALTQARLSCPFCSRPGEDPGMALLGGLSRVGRPGRARIRSSIAARHGSCKGAQGPSARMLGAAISSFSQNCQPCARYGATAGGIPGESIIGTLCERGTVAAAANRSQGQGALMSSNKKQGCAEGRKETIFC